MCVKVKGYIILGFVLMFDVCRALPFDFSISSKKDTIEEKPRIEAGQFARLIKDKTGLVSIIESNTTEVIRDGLTRTEIVYVNKHNKQIVLHVLFADLDKGVGLIASAAENGVDLHAKETVVHHIDRVQTRGYNVLAAVNGDFWKERDTEEDDTPLGQTYGPLYMEGLMYKDMSSISPYYFAGILKDGSFVIGDKTYYNNHKRCIKEAIGGKHLLVEGSKDVSHEIHTKDTDTRTSIGIFDSEKVVFIVADGGSLSQATGRAFGLALQDLGKIYEAIGVQTAVNLGGAASTTLITKNDSGGLSVKERPLNGNGMIAVANAWVLVGK